MASNSGLLDQNATLLLRRKQLKEQKKVQDGVKTWTWSPAQEHQRQWEDANDWDKLNDAERSGDKEQEMNILTRVWENWFDPSKLFCKSGQWREWITGEGYVLNCENTFINGVEPKSPLFRSKSSPALLGDFDQEGVASSWEAVNGEIRCGPGQQDTFHKRFAYRLGDGREVYLGDLLTSSATGPDRQPVLRKNCFYCPVCSPPKAASRNNIFGGGSVCDAFVKGNCKRRPGFCKFVHCGCLEHVDLQLIKLLHGFEAFPESTTAYAARKQGKTGKTSQ